MSSASTPRLRIIVEGTLIISSILIAFAIQAWWDESQERKAEWAALGSLRTEFALNLDELAAKTIGHRHSERAALRLVRIIDGVVPLPDEPIDSLIWATFLNASTFEARTGVLDGLLSAGQLGIIRDGDIRTLLASWRAQLDDTSEEEEWIVNDIRTLWRPYLVRHSLVRVAERVYPFFHDIGPGARAYDFAGVIADPEFESLVLLRLEDERVTLEAYEEMRVETQTVLDLIEAELSR